MPTVKTRTKPAPLVICIESFSSGDSEYGACARGTKLRADNEIVRRRPHMFAPADLADHEDRQRQQQDERAYFNQQSAAPEAGPTTRHPNQVQKLISDGGQQQPVADSAAS
jgi:hypothetical protein